MKPAGGTWMVAGRVYLYFLCWVDGSDFAVACVCVLVWVSGGSIVIMDRSILYLNLVL